MKAAIDLVKGALATKDFGTHMNHYLFEPGWVLASDGRMTAAAPTGLELNCLVPGPELEAVLSTFHEDVEVSHAKDVMSVTAGDLRAGVRTLPVDVVSFFRPEGEWINPPDGFVAALKLAQPFIAEQAVQAWALCACLRKDAVVSTNNMSIMQADCPGLEVDGDVLLPSWAVEFIVSKKAAMDGVMWRGNYAAFRWADGTWLRTQLVEGAFPTQITGLLAAPERAVVPVAKSWLKAYVDVATLSENSVKIGPAEMTGTRLGPDGRVKMDVRADVKTDVDKEVLFNPKFLTPVLAKAEYWAPDVWPAPVPFRGKGFSGVVVGRKA